METALPALCRASQRLPVELQARLATLWSGPGRNSLRQILENLQQLVTLRVIVTQFEPNFYVQDENVVTSATELMKVKKISFQCIYIIHLFLLPIQVVYYANILAGVLESPELRHDESISVMEDSFLGIKLTRNPLPPDPLGKCVFNTFFFKVHTVIYIGTLNCEVTFISEADNLIFISFT